MIEHSQNNNPDDSQDPRKQELSRESLTVLAREAGLYRGPDINELPYVPAERISNILRALISDTDPDLMKWQLVCSASTLSYEVEEAVELVRFQQDYEVSEPTAIYPEGYRYRGGNQMISMYVLDRKNGHESYPGSTYIFSTLPRSLTSRMADAWHEDVGTMHTYLILDAYLPVSESEFGTQIPRDRE